MKIQNLAELAERNSVTAEDAFDQVEAALGHVLPGSDYHTRYRDIDSIGLAVVLGKDGVTPDFYNPLLPGLMGKLSFAASNQDMHPEMWDVQETDAGVVGGDMPKELGRFTTFAAAKINTLTFAPTSRTSHRIKGVSIAPGQVGLAGGRRTADSLLATSGLWELHDHVVSQAYASNLAKQVDGNPVNAERTIDDLAEGFEAIFDVIQKLHSGTEAAELSRIAISILLIQVIPDLHRTFPLPRLH